MDGEQSNESTSIGQENVPQVQAGAAQAGTAGNLCGSAPQAASGLIGSIPRNSVQ